MAHAIRVVTDKLLGLGILETDSGYSMQASVLSALHGQGRRRQWGYKVDRRPGFVFKRVQDRDRRAFAPVVSIDRIDVNDDGDARPPFEALDASLELRYEHENQRTIRWHIDKANRQEDDEDGVPRYQEGPRFHLQHGGHANTDRALDERVNLPRWSYPPLDLVLLLEFTTANFFPNDWRELSLDTSWREQIQLSQRLCFTHFADRLTSCLTQSRGSYLRHVWSDVWKDD